MPENADQKNSEYGYFLRSTKIYLLQWLEQNTFSISLLEETV